MEDKKYEFILALNDMNSYDAEKYEFILQLTNYEFIELTKSMNSYSEQRDMNSHVGDMNS